MSSVAFFLILMSVALTAGLLGRRSLIRRAAAMPEDHWRELSGRLLEEAVALPPGRDGYISLANTSYGRTHAGEWSAVKAYLRRHQLATVRSTSIRPTPLGRRLVAQRTAGKSNSTYHIVNYGSMVAAQDITGGIVNAGTIEGDVVQGATSEQVLALVAAIRADLTRVDEPALRAQATEVADQLDRAAAKGEPVGRSLLERAALLISVGQGAFTLTQNVLAAIFGS